MSSREWSEARRNRLLRRADWRFLLDQPNPRTIVSFARGQLARSAANIANELLEPHEATGRADLVVASDPSERRLQEVMALLRSGGELYAEYHRPFPQPAAVIHSLRAAGFVRVRAHWAWPPAWTGRTKLWLPVGSSRGMEYVSSARAPLRPPILRTSGWLVLLAWAIARRLIPGYPLSVTAQKPLTEATRATQSPTAWASRNAVAAVDSLPDPIARHLHRSALALGTHGERLTWLLQTLGPHSKSKVVALVFDDTAAEPLAVVKLARTDQAAGGLLREAGTLQRLQSGVCPPAGIPHVLFSTCWNGFRAIGETSLVGKPLWMRIERGDGTPLARRAAHWLAELAEQECDSKENYGVQIAISTCDDFAHRFGEVVDPKLWHHTQAVFRELDGTFCVCEHRDFSPWNIVARGRDELAVFDWESSTLQGLPLLDLVYYHAFHAFFHHGAMRTGRLEECYRAALDRHTAMGRLGEHCLNEYRERLGLPAAWVAPLRLLTWMVHACSAHQQLLEDGGGRPMSARALRRMVHFRLWREEALQQLAVSRGA